MPSAAFLRRLSQVREETGWTGRLYIDLAQGRLIQVSVPIQQTVFRRGVDTTEESCKMKPLTLTN